MLAETQIVLTLCDKEEFSVFKLSLLFLTTDEIKSGCQMDTLENFLRRVPNDERCLYVIRRNIDFFLKMREDPEFELLKVIIIGKKKALIPPAKKNSLSLLI